MSARDEKEAWLLQYLNDNGLAIPRRSKLEEIVDHTRRNVCRIKDLEMKVQPLEKRLDHFLPIVEAVHKAAIMLLEMFNGHERRLKRIEEILKIPEPQQKPAGDAGARTGRES